MWQKRNMPADLPIQYLHGAHSSQSGARQALNAQGKSCTGSARLDALVLAAAPPPAAARLEALAAPPPPRLAAVHVGQPPLPSIADAAVDVEEPPLTEIALLAAPSIAEATDPAILSSAAPPRMLAIGDAPKNNGLTSLLEKIIQQRAELKEDRRVEALRAYM